GATSTPVRAGGGAIGDRVSVIADLGGDWRPGYRDRQWDSTSRRGGTELRGMAEVIARLRPAAAKDVSMAGLAGTLGMLAEASGTGAELDVAAIPRPAGASMGAWLGCFPGFAMVVADPEPVHTVPAPLTAAPCGRLTAEPGVRLRWPDGTITVAVGSGVTGLGTA
uniref:AIR synthase-related protein n=1 Tax=Nocardia miyunensis TaxID=282684 RepID=UPI000A5FA83E